MAPPRTDPEEGILCEENIDAEGDEAGAEASDAAAARTSGATSTSAPNGTRQGSCGGAASDGDARERSHDGGGGGGSEVSGRAARGRSPAARRGGAAARGGGARGRGGGGRGGAVRRGVRRRRESTSGAASPAGGPSRDSSPPPPGAAQGGDRPKPPPSASRTPIQRGMPMPMPEPPSSKRQRRRRLFPDEVASDGGREAPAPAQAVMPAYPRDTPRRLLDEARDDDVGAGVDALMSLAELAHAASNSEALAPSDQDSPGGSGGEDGGGGGGERGGAGSRGGLATPLRPIGGDHIYRIDTPGTRPEVLLASPGEDREGTPVRARGGRARAAARSGAGTPASDRGGAAREAGRSARDTARERRDASDAAAALAALQQDIVAAEGGGVGPDSLAASEALSGEEEGADDGADAEMQGDGEYSPFDSEGSPPPTARRARGRGRGGRRRGVKRGLPDGFGNVAAASEPRSTRHRKASAALKEAMEAEGAAEGEGLDLSHPPERPPSPSSSHPAASSHDEADEARPPRGGGGGGGAPRGRSGRGRGGAAAAAAAAAAKNALGATQRRKRPPERFRPALGPFLARFRQTGVVPEGGGPLVGETGEVMGGAEGVLRHALGPALRRWCACEWHYSAIDRPWFLENKMQDLLTLAGLGHVTHLSRVEWGLLRGAWGRPRRLSLAFLRQERARLAAHRDQVRHLYEACDYGQELPPDVPRPLRVGQAVVARHPATRALHDGIILTTKPTSYRVQFTRGDLYTEVIPDVDIMPQDPADCLPPALLVRPALLNGRATHAAAAARRRLGLGVGAARILGMPGAMVGGGGGGGGGGIARAGLLGISGGGGGGGGMMPGAMLLDETTREADTRLIDALEGVLDRKAALLQQLRELTSCGDRGAAAAAVGGGAEGDASFASALAQLQQINAELQSLLAKQQQRAHLAVMPSSIAASGVLGGSGGAAAMAAPWSPAPVAPAGGEVRAADTAAAAAAMVAAAVADSRTLVSKVLQQLQQQQQRQPDQGATAAAGAAEAPQPEALLSPRAEELITSCISLLHCLLRGCTGGGTAGGAGSVAVTTAALDALLARLQPVCPANEAAFQEVAASVAGIKALARAV